MTAPPQVNGHKRPAALPVVWDWRPVETTGSATVWEKSPPAPEPVAETVPQPAGPAVDHVAIAKAEAIRQEAAAEAEAKRIKADAEAAALVAKAEVEAEKLRIANTRAAMKLEADQAAHAKRLAELEDQRSAAELASERKRKDADADAEREADRSKEQQRSETLWKWGARGIYAVGLIIAAPVQFLDFWDRQRPFLVAAPALIEGFALVLACGAAWAVAHRRDVMPYRIGIMLAAAIAATINLRGGMTNAAIGFNAGMIGAIASLGGPIVLMAYEHGIAQKADGILSWRERRAANKTKAAEDAARNRTRDERKATEKKAADEKQEQQARADAEQQRKDADRRQQHLEVWEVAEALRSARGAQVVTEQIWGDAWYRVTGSKVVGITAEIEAQSRLAAAQMKAATECLSDDAALQVNSQMPARPKKDPTAPDARRFNGGVPPLRQAGDTRPYSDAARKAASITALAIEEQK